MFVVGLAATGLPRQSSSGAVGASRNVCAICAFCGLISPASYGEASPHFVLFDQHFTGKETADHSIHYTISRIAITRAISRLRQRWLAVW